MSLTPAVILIAERRFRSYNKTRFMHDALTRAFGSLQYLEIEPRTSLPVLNKLDQLIQYCRLAVRLHGLPGQSILWLSEFKFSIANVIASRIVASFNGLTLVGGPHTLEADSNLLTRPELQRGCLTRFQKFHLAVLMIRDGFLVRQFDVLQSYSEEYAERIRTSSGEPGKPTIICPIGSALPADLPRWKSRERKGEIRVIFWGIASALHGLALLAPAFARLRAKGLKARAQILSPENWFTQQLRDEARRHDVSSLFEFDPATKVSDDPRVVYGSDIALSHLVAGNISRQAQVLAGTLLTNKMYEVLEMGMPLLVARTPATARLVPRDCAIFTEPGDADSVAETIWHAAAQEDRLQATGGRGRAYFEEHLALDATARQLGASLRRAGAWGS